MQIRHKKIVATSGVSQMRANKEQKRVVVLSSSLLTPLFNDPSQRYTIIRAAMFRQTRERATTFTACCLRPRHCLRKQQWWSLVFVPGYSLGRPHRAVIRSGNSGNASLPAPVALGDNVNIWLTGSQRTRARLDGVMTDDVISTRVSSLGPCQYHTQR